MAFHYPPILQSSGVHRTAKFVQYLPEFDWQPIVLTAHPRAYPVKDDHFEKDFDNLVIKRAFALNSAKHLSVYGRYMKWTALPDRWISWCAGAIPSGLSLIKKHKPAFIYSTYPIASAHLIAYALHKMTGVPWIADFRDPMTDTNYPADHTTKRIYQWIEKQAITNSIHNLFTTKDSCSMLKERFPQINADKFSVIANGYDEQIFTAIESSTSLSVLSKSGQTVLVHSGTLYLSERNPVPFFKALAALKDAQQISSENLKVILRASGADEHFSKIIRDLKLDDIVYLEKSLKYSEALIEMIKADGLLIFQASNCNHQIPAKAYEYLRAKTPIFSLTDIKGNTAQLLSDAGINSFAPIDDIEKIKSGLMHFIEQIRSNKWQVASDSVISSHSRWNRTKELACLLNTLSN